MTTHTLARRGWLYDDAPAIQLPALGKEGRHKPLPLSLNERAAWIVTQESPDNVYLNMKTLLMITGALDPTALTQAIDHVVQQHEILRTTYHQDPQEKLYRDIHETATITVNWHDLSTQAPAEQQIQLQQLAQRAEHKRFSLDKLPLFEFNIATLSLEKHVIIFCMHHIIGDGFSVGLLLRAILQNHGQLLKGELIANNNVALSYTDYAIWQQNIYQQSLWSPMVNYWENKMAEVEEIRLPYSAIKKPFLSNAAKVETLIIRAELINELNRYAALHKVSLYVILMGALQLLIKHLTGQQTLLIETILANRNSIERVQLLGSLATEGVALYQIENTYQVTDFLTRILRQTLEINKLQQDCGLLIYNTIARRFPGMPAVGINFHSQYLKALPGLEIIVDDSFFAKNTLPGNLDLFLEIWPQNQQLKIDFVYRDCLFEKSVVVDFTKKYLGIINFFIQHPHARLGEYRP